MSFELCEDDKVLAKGAFGSVRFGRVGGVDASGNVIVKKELVVKISDSGILQEVDVWTTLPPHPNVTKGILSGVLEGYVELADSDSGDESDDGMEKIPFINVLPVYDENYGDALDYIMRSTNKVKGWVRKRELIDTFVFQMCLGVKHLHDNGYVHGDLKGANVLVKGIDYTAGTGCVALADFGLTYRWSYGQPPYMSNGGSYGRPNAHYGDVQYDTSALDIFALGIILGGVDGFSLFWKRENSNGGLTNTTEGSSFMKMVFRYVSMTTFGLTSDERKLLAYDLFRGMFNPDINARFTIDQVINHPYFDGVRDIETARCFQAPTVPDFECGDVSLVNAFAIRYTDTRVRENCPIYGVDVDTLRFILDNSTAFFDAIQQGLYYYVDHAAVSNNSTLTSYRSSFQSRKMCIDMAWAVGRYIHLTATSASRSGGTSEGGGSGSTDHIIPSTEVIAQIYIILGLIIGIGHYYINTQTLVQGAVGYRYGMGAVPLDPTIIQTFNGVVAPTEIKTKRSQIYALKPVELVSGEFGDDTPIVTMPEEVFKYWDWCTKYTFGYFSPEETIQRIFCDGLWGDEVSVVDSYYSEPLLDEDYEDEEKYIDESSYVWAKVKVLVEWVFQIADSVKSYGKYRLPDDALSLVMKLLHEIIADCIDGSTGKWKTIPGRFGVVIANNTLQAAALSCISVAMYYTHFLPLDFDFARYISADSLNVTDFADYRESIGRVYTHPSFEKRTSYGYLNDMLSTTGADAEAIKLVNTLLRNSYKTPSTFLYHPYEVAQTVMNVYNGVGGEGGLYDAISRV